MLSVDIERIANGVVVTFWEADCRLRIYYQEVGDSILDITGFMGGTITLHQLAQEVRQKGGH